MKLLFYYVIVFSSYLQYVSYPKLYEKSLIFFSLKRHCGHKIIKHLKILVWFDSPQVKWNMKSSAKKHCIRVASRVAERLMS